VQLVDWRLAAATGARLVPPGPSISLAEAVATVESLRAAADKADEHVAAITGLDAAKDSAVTVVVDRPTWIRANVEGFALLVDPIVDSLVEQKPAALPGPVLGAVGSRAAGLEVGVLLSYLGTKVLGQFELLGPPRSAADETAPGRLTLVAPNVIAAERTLGAAPEDFRLWVCLHEVTHRTQFAAAPWLHQHVQGLLREFVLAAELDAPALLTRLRDAVSGAKAAGRGRGEASLVELIQTPGQRQALDRLTGLMSLLEGHADVVMDQVGPDVVPTVREIRAAFDLRRKTANPLSKLIRRLMGLEMKLKQYAEGAEFVRAVIAEIGMDGLNTVWTAPDRLPTGAEIRDPARWLARAAVPPAVTV
jgi:coenzyme F420 biosynthesis associated uncharacterized protein